MHTVKIRLLFFMVCLGCLFLCSCGLDEYYEIKPPQCDNPVSIDLQDTAQMYYQFTVPAVTVVTSSQIDTRGTSVYYKIYTDADKAETQRKAIYESNKEYSESGFNKMMSYGSSSESDPKYQPMSFTAASGNSTEYIPTATEEITWYITISETTETEVVLRLKRNLNQDSNNDYLIHLQKPDTSSTLYLNAYAVVVGVDTSMKTQRSQLAPLGVLKF